MGIKPVTLSVGVKILELGLYLVQGVLTADGFQPSIAPLQHETDALEAFVLCFNYNRVYTLSFTL